LKYVNPPPHFTSHEERIMGTATDVECALGSPTKGKRQRCDL